MCIRDSRCSRCRSSGSSRMDSDTKCGRDLNGPRAAESGRSLFIFIAPSEQRWHSELSELKRLGGEPYAGGRVNHPPERIEGVLCVAREVPRIVRRVVPLSLIHI